MILFQKCSEKIFIFLTIIFFAILFFQLIYSRLGTDFILDNYFDEFDTYFEARKNPLTQTMIGIIHLLKYVVFVFLLIIKRKLLLTMAPEKNRRNCCEIKFFWLLSNFVLNRKICTSKSPTFHIRYHYLPKFSNISFVVFSKSNSGVQPQS